MSQANVRCHVFIILIYLSHKFILLAAAELSSQQKERSCAPGNLPVLCDPGKFSADIFSKKKGNLSTILQDLQTIFFGISSVFKTQKIDIFSFP